MYFVFTVVIGHMHIDSWKETVLVYALERQKWLAETFLLTPGRCPLHVRSFSGLELWC